MKKKDERKLHVAEIRMLRSMCGVTRIDKVRRLNWCGHVMRREEIM
jgi:hypothetical protein